MKQAITQSKFKVQILILLGLHFAAFEVYAQQLYSDANVSLYSTIYAIDGSDCVYEGKTYYATYYKCKYTVINKSGKRMMINGRVTYDATIRTQETRHIGAGASCNKNVNQWTTSEYQWSNWSIDPGTYEYVTYFWTEWDKSEPTSWSFQYDFPTGPDGSSVFLDFTFENGEFTDAHLQLGGTTAEAYLQQKNNKKAGIKPMSGSGDLENQMSQLQQDISHNYSVANQNLNNATNGTSNWAQSTINQNTNALKANVDICYADLYNTQGKVASDGCDKVMQNMMNDPTTKAIMNGNYNAVNQNTVSKSLNMLENIRAQCGSQFPPEVRQMLDQTISQIKASYK